MELLGKRSKRELEQLVATVLIFLAVTILTWTCCLVDEAQKHGDSLSGRMSKLISTMEIRK
jgi:hypothetical protein